ncbi:MAG: hypothetical protein EBS20_08105, partial [Actinobacteria bacterium]|nr:hypothetical protein [Actinomycetota bacterium]
TAADASSNTNNTEVAEIVPDTVIVAPVDAHADVGPSSIGPCREPGAGGAQFAIVRSFNTGFATSPPRGPRTHSAPLMTRMITRATEL